MGNWFSTPYPFRKKVVVSRNPTGQKINEKYMIFHDQVLGRGSYGVVRECIDLSSGEKLACKTMSKMELESKDRVEHVRREIAILRHLKNHPNIVSIKDVCEDDNELHIVTELLKGKTLDYILHRVPLPEKEASTIIRTLVEIIQVLHNNGVIHRDIKFENFMFGGSTNNIATLKVIDFGISVFYNPGDTCKLSSCTRHYVAPEVLMGNNQDPEVDIWAAGVILYILLCGIAPFRKDNTDELREAIIHAEVCYERPPWPDVSNEAKDLVKKMLNPNPNERLTAHQVLSHPWVQRRGGRSWYHQLYMKGFYAHVKKWLRGCLNLLMKTVCAPSGIRS
ncbi:unnamed protein product [Cuscuta europaea]|uniref:Protein kinase domain-containing protein n=1 Tax=Cuscuta europaea TaxID=41803 RepID=A0A9P1ENC2_CUSEU|nr:unnamed protein product [Cuscuta europaea]